MNKNLNYGYNVKKLQNCIIQIMILNVMVRLGRIRMRMLRENN